jgi:hypothetical protein
MILSKALTTAQIANQRAAELFNPIFCIALLPPTIDMGRPQSIIPPYSKHCVNIYLKTLHYINMRWWSSCRVNVMKPSIGMVITSICWSKKVAHQVTKEQNVDLYLHSLLCIWVSFISLLILPPVPLFKFILVGSYIVTALLWAIIILHLAILLPEDFTSVKTRLQDSFV